MTSLFAQAQRSQILARIAPHMSALGGKADIPFKRAKSGHTGMFSRHVGRLVKCPQIIQNQTAVQNSTLFFFLAKVFKYEHADR
jgi:hypothetical protein